jgi:hypothetical protein
MNVPASTSSPHENLLHGGVVGVASPRCWALMLIHPNCWEARCIALLRLMAVFGEVTDLPTIVARVSSRRELLWWPDCHLLLLLCWRRAIILLLLWAVAPELWQRSARLCWWWCIDHAVHRRSTARTASGGSWHGPLPLLLFSLFTCLHGALLVNGGTY